jgi:hypothetical protein
LQEAIEGKVMPKHPGRTGRPPKLGLSAEPLTKLSFNLPVSLHRRFKLACVTHNLNMADTMREAVEERTRKLEKMK